MKNRVFLVDDDKHDSEEKTVLSNIGNFDGVDVINILLAQESSAKFLVKNYSIPQIFCFNFW